MNIKYKYFYTLIIFVGITLIACKKDKEVVEREYPQVNTLEVTHISDSGATFEADVFSAGHESIIDHGFVWGINETNLSIGASDRISLGTFSGTGKYDAQIRSTLEVEKKYFVRSFVKTSNHTFYGPTVSFISLGSNGPVINNFEPKNVKWGDTLYIYGKNFSKVNSNNRVFLNEQSTNCITVCDSAIKISIPRNIQEKKYIVSVETSGNRGLYTRDSLVLILPIVLSYNPESITWNDTVYIVGEFPEYNSYNYNATINGSNISIIEATPSLIKLIFPNSINLVNSKIKISINNYCVSDSIIINLKPPTIKNIFPLEGFSNQIITLTGKYLKPGYTKVKVGNNNANIQGFINDSTLLFYMPSQSSEGDYPISVNVLGQVYQAAQTISFKVPKITKVEPYDVTFNDTLSIYGNFFSSNPSSNSVLINAACCGGEKIIFASPSLIKIVIPTNIYYGNPYIKVSSPLGECLINNAFKIIRPTISSVSKNEGHYGDTVIIRGNNFNPDINQCFVNIGKTISASKESIIFTLNNITSGIKAVNLYHSSFGEIPISGNFNFISPYKKINSNGFNSTFGFSFTINGNGYFGGNDYGSGIAKYSPTENKWEGIADFSDSKTLGPAYFSVNDKGYIICGTNLGYSSAPDRLKKTVIEFDPATNSVVEKKEFPGMARTGSFGFSIGKKGYVGCGVNNNVMLADFWEYDPITDTWIQKADFPGGACKGITSFVIENKAYVLKGKELWCYSPIEDIWERKSDFPGASRYSAIGFAINKTGYIANGSPYFGYYLTSPTTFYNDLWCYNQQTDTWIPKTPYPGRPSFGCTSFVIDNKAYLGFGTMDRYNGRIFSDEFFEYDSSLEQQ